MSRLRWSLVFLAATFVAFVLGFCGLAGRAGMIVAYSKVLSIAFALVFLASLFAGKMPTPPTKKHAAHEHRIRKPQPKSN